MTKEKDQPTQRGWSAAASRSPDDIGAETQPMSGGQAQRLQELCKQTGAEFDESLSFEVAANRIAELEERLRAGH